MSKALLDLLAPIHAAYQADPEWQEITDKAYPSTEKKKVKKVKNKGTRYPGAGQESQGLPDRTKQDAPVQN